MTEHATQACSDLADTFENWAPCSARAWRTYRQGVGERSSVTTRFPRRLQASEQTESAPAIDCGLRDLNLEMALQMARKDAREHARGSGVFPGRFPGRNLGAFEQMSSALSRPCALAHPILHAAVEAPPNFPLTPSQR
jgi:hypothetical protein